MLRYLDDEHTLIRYMEIKAEMKRLEAEMRQLQPALLSALWEEPENRTEFGGHELVIGTRKTYAYSPAVEALQDELKALKRREEATGLATVTRHTSYVMCRALRG